MKHLTRDKTQTVTSMGFFNIFGRTISFRAQKNGAVIETDTRFLRNDDPDLVDLHLHGGPIAEIEEALISAYPDLNWARDKMKILYICAEGLGDGNFAKRSFPVYQLRGGEISLSDTRRLGRRRAFDFIVFSSLDDNLENRPALEMAVGRCLKRRDDPANLPAPRQVWEPQFAFGLPPQSLSAA